MSTTATSTLSELHLKVIDKMYSYLNAVDATQWVNPNQIFYSPIFDWETAIRIWMKKNNNNNLKFPLGVLTRHTDIRTENDISRRGWYTDFLKTNITSATSTDSYSCLPVKIDYDFVIYDDTFNNMEKICEILIFMRGRNFTQEYQSDLINEKLNFYITYEDMPTYEMIPDANERFNGKGSIYSLKYTFKVDGIIAISTGLKERILTTTLNQDIDGDVISVTN